MPPAQPDPSYELPALETANFSISETKQSQLATTKAAAAASIPTKDAQVPVRNECNDERAHLEQGAEDHYPGGLTFMLLTIGLMAVVLVVALDNYIIGSSLDSIPSACPITD